MKVLVLGAGQLAQMMYLAAAPLGIEVLAVDVSDNSVVHPMSKAPYGCDLESAIADVTAITVEFEHIPEPLLAQVQKSGKLFPNIESILAGADRVREKHLLDTHNVPNCPYQIITDVAQLQNIEQTLGDKIIFKPSRDGYDGYGQRRMQTLADLPDLLEVFAKLDLLNVPLIAESMVDFDREISVIGARDQRGNIHFFDIAENLHYQGQLHVSVAPATRLTPTINNEALKIFKTIADALDYVGVLAVELFQLGDTLLVNEIAPRVHNSGHWTQKGADTSQFEQHIRAVLGLPLGSTQTRQVTAMVNIIGCTDLSRQLMAIEGCHLHWYGKTLREKRKMGHINIVADSYNALGEKLVLLLTHLPEQSFPMLAGEADRLKSL
jgi:5-(carboxyamino)imidazole ribonucleotide synthase